MNLTAKELAELDKRLLFEAKNHWAERARKAEAEAARLRVETFKECLEEFNRLEARMESVGSSWPITDYQNWLERNAGER